MKINLTEIVLIAIIWIIVFAMAADYIHNDTLRITAEHCKQDGHFKVDRHVYTCEEQH